MALRGQVGGKLVITKVVIGLGALSCVPAQGAGPPRDAAAIAPGAAPPEWLLFTLVGRAKPGGGDRVSADGAVAPTGAALSGGGAMPKVSPASK
mmetsp:Transcript_38771/g.106821  ORF Transcript_38771/g.106821 Transcript_38771/m.106821 type:complete len:94 (+) Transcript_38771:763-1044(+)